MFGDKLKGVLTKVQTAAKEGKLGDAAQKWSQGIVPMENKVTLEKETKTTIYVVVGVLILAMYFIFKKK
jgi:hypothetical protein